MLSYTYIVQTFDLSSTVLEVIMRERDTQRSKLYRAERAALSSIASPLPTVGDIERYLEGQSARATLRSRYGKAVDVSDWKLRVTDGRRCRRALAYGTYKIAIPRWARNDWVVLHEWAHIVHARITAMENGECLPRMLVTAAASPSLQAARATAGSMPRSIWIWFDFA